MTARVRADAAVSGAARARRSVRSVGGCTGFVRCLSRSTPCRASFRTSENLKLFFVCHISSRVWSACNCASHACARERAAWPGIARAFADGEYAAALTLSLLQALLRARARNRLYLFACSVPCLRIVACVMCAWSSVIGAGALDVEFYCCCCSAAAATAALLLLLPR